jgi:hypothetical protein
VEKLHLVETGAKCACFDADTGTCIRTSHQIVMNPNSAEDVAKRVRCWAAGVGRRAYRVA